MEKRRIVFGNYNTAVHGWTLTGWELSAAEEKTNFIDKQGGDGSWDLSTALTEGIPRYKDRKLVATFECSEGDRESRELSIREMVNTLDGMREDIELPDDVYHYINGKLHVVREYNDLAHAAVSVTATCGPWKHSKTEKVITLEAETEKQTAQLENVGRRVVVPIISVSKPDDSTEAEVLLEYSGASMALSAGVYQWPDLLLRPGKHPLTYSGAGTVVITYREAVLE